MDTLSKPAEVQVAEINRDAKTKVAKAIALATLYVVLGVIFMTAILTHQPLDFIKWLGGSEVAIGIFGTILL